MIYIKFLFIICLLGIGFCFYSLAIEQDNKAKFIPSINSNFTEAYMENVTIEYFHNGIKTEVYLPKLVIKK